VSIESALTNGGRVGKARLHQCFGDELERLHRANRADVASQLVRPLQEERDDARGAVRTVRCVGSNDKQRAQPRKKE
jgi:hypothetical protein